MTAPRSDVRDMHTPSLQSFFARNALFHFPQPYTAESLDVTAFFAPLLSYFCYSQGRLDIA